MKESIRQIAIIGPTASGKSALAVAIASKFDAIILSLDSLSIYKEIDIASAKPTLSERKDILHLGIDLLKPDEKFDTTLFAKLYQEAYIQAQREGKNLIIVGGTSFYLKTVVDGISPLPPVDSNTKNRVLQALSHKAETYNMLSSLDPEYMKKISIGDRYRIEKALTILYTTQMIPSDYYRENPPISSLKGKLPIYRIAVDKTELRKRITTRTEEMLARGLIDEVASLEKKYTRSPHCMKAIGIRETLDFLDGRYDRAYLKERIITNTARLAKRQNTFNRSQFADHPSLEIEALKEKIENELKEN